MLSRKQQPFLLGLNLLIASGTCGLMQIMMLINIIFFQYTEQFRNYIRFGW